MSVEQSLVNLMRPLNTMQIDHIAQLSDLAVSFLVKPTECDLQTSLSDFAKDNSCTLTSATLKSLMQGLLIFFQEAIREGYGFAKLEVRCVEIGLVEIATKIISKLWRRRFALITSSLLSRSITNNQLVDMEWTFGVTAASDDCDNVGKTYLQLKLILEGENGRKTIFIELSLDQFYQFLASMEKCRSYLDYVSPL